jgi:hypothetical protein
VRGRGAGAVVVLDALLGGHGLAHRGPRHLVAGIAMIQTCGAMAVGRTTKDGSDMNNYNFVGEHCQRR